MRDRGRIRELPNGKPVVSEFLQDDGHAPGFGRMVVLMAD
jgi:hypothetical protein